MIPAWPDANATKDIMTTMTQSSNKNHAHSVKQDDSSKVLSYGDHQNSPIKRPTKRVGILGGGTAGSTIAIRLAALGLETYLFEKKKSRSKNIFGQNTSDLRYKET